jgi:LPXTG-site transpeptidase (sortase) family protein
MRLKKISRQKLFLVILVWFGFLLIFILEFLLNNPAKKSLAFIAEKTNTPQIQEKISFGLPTRLKIPSINVDAIIDQVGLTPDGAMDVPKTPTNTAWFNLGPRPGEIGSSVIDGHFGWGKGLAAVFDNLSKLRQGDKIYTEDDKGLINTFIVKESKSYDSQAVATEVFKSNDNKAHLNLITCEGVWNKAEKNYSKRLVIFTDKE